MAESCAYCLSTYNSTQLKYSHDQTRSRASSSPPTNERESLLEVNDLSLYLCVPRPTHKLLVWSLLVWSLGRWLVAFNLTRLSANSKQVLKPRQVIRSIEVSLSTHFPTPRRARTARSFLLSAESPQLSSLLWQCVAQLFSHFLAAPSDFPPLHALPSRSRARCQLTTAARLA